jgi:glycosyltransferase involved in cell wall biosynthesis
MSDVLITVLVPLKRPHRGFLDSALQSLLEQGSPRWRALLIADADDEALQGFVPPDARIARIPNEGTGLCGNLNTGMRRAESPFVAILQGDDRLEPSAIRVMERYIRLHPHIDFFHSSFRYIDHEGRSILAPRLSCPARTRTDFLEHNVTHFMCWNVQSALAMGGMDPTLGPHGADDYDFPWSMWDSGAQFLNVPEILYCYREHSEHFRLTTHVPLQVQVLELRKIFAKHGLDSAQIECEIEKRLRDYLWQALYP